MSSYQGPIENGRRVFLEYMRAINDLQTQPKFYNTLTTNCTNVILAHTESGSPSVLVEDERLRAEYVYESGRFVAISFDELKKRSHVNAAARAADHAPDFSERIRAGPPSRSTAVR